MTKSSYSTSEEEPELEPETEKDRVNVPGYREDNSRGS
jgi:hypothetical protein